MGCETWGFPGGENMRTKPSINKDEVKEWLREERDYANQGLRRAETVRTNNVESDERTIAHFRRRLEILNILCKRHRADK
jgi:hypothetical protein